MNRVLPVVFAFCFSITGLLAQEKTLEYSYLSNLEKKNIDVLNQGELRKASAWQSFSGASKKWYVEFDEISGMPHRAIGQPIPINSNDETSVIEFFQEELSGFNLPLNDLELTSKPGSSRIAFKQVHRGIEVFMASAFVFLNQNNEISLFGIDLHTQIDLNVSPSFSKDDIIPYLTKDFRHFDKVSIEDELVIVPVPSPNASHYEYHLAYQAYVIDEFGPSEWYTLVDAHSGEILYRQNEVLNCLEDHDHKISPPPAHSPELLSGSLYLTHPFDPISTVGLPYLKVESGANTFYSDSAGFIGISSIGTAHFPLIGKYVKVLDRSRGDAIPTFNLNLSKTGRELHYTGRDGIDDQHLGAYYHTNVIHDHMSSFFGPVTGLDTAISAIVKRSDGSCNAFYRGSENTINFYTTSNGCNSLAKVADVVYHEYGHAINRNRYGGDGRWMINGGLNEGYADVWSIGLTKELKLGVGFSVTNKQRTVRRYDTIPKVFPQDYVNQVHGDGEMIAGAWIDLALKIGYQNMLERFTSIFSVSPPPDGPSGSRYVQGRIYRDVLVEALIADDDDGNLWNGTPNGQDILDAFAAHGIVLIENYEAVHQDKEFAQLNKDTKLDVTVVKDSLLNWQGNSLELMPVLNYTDSLGKSYTKLTMAEDSKNLYSASIPARSSHALLSYFISLEDTAGNVFGTIPENASSGDANLPFFILYGYSPWASEDFEGGANTFGTWQTSVIGDDATNGNWEITAPVASHFNSDTNLAEIQPGSPFDGTKCAVTKNASSKTASILEASVDEGITTLRSPFIDLSRSIDPVICYRRWYTNAAGGYTVRDYWQAQIMDGTLPFRDMEKTKTEDPSWRRNAIRVRDFKPLTSTMLIQFVAEKDRGRGVVEAAVDAIVIYDVAATGTEGLANETFSIYPNPTEGVVNLKMSFKAGKKDFVEVRDVQGRIATKIMLENGSLNEQLNLTELNKGIYIISLHQGEAAQHKRLVIN